MYKKLIEASKKIVFCKEGRLEGYMDTVTGKHYPRITSVLSYDGSKANALMIWAKKVAAEAAENIMTKELGGFVSSNLIEDVTKAILGEADKQRDEAGDKGTNVHDNIEKAITGQKYIDVDGRVALALKLLEDNGLEFITGELPVIWHSDDYSIGVGGRFDALFKDEFGEYVLGDYKTSKSVHSGYALQTAKYCQAIKQMSGLEISEVKIIHLPDMNALSDWQRKDFNKHGNVLTMDKDTFPMAIKQFDLLLHQYEGRNNKYFVNEDR
jgi:ribosomal protein L18